MAVTLADFDKIWASTSPLTPYSFSDKNYKQGWNFVGSTPPARQMWDFIQKQNDEKAKYIVDNYVSLTDLTTATVEQANKLTQQLIPNGADLNDYTGVGVYFAGSDSDANSLLNKPNLLSVSFTMYVSAAGAGRTQVIYSGSNIFTRKRTSSTWQRWYTFTGEADT